MAPVFIFAEQVQSVVRSGEKEIEIPEGARISSAAADLIKENKISIKIVAPGALSSGKSQKAEKKSPEKAIETETPKPVSPPASKQNSDVRSENFSDISEGELEDIVNLVIERFKQLKNRSPEAANPAQSFKAEESADAAIDEDELVICRCEEITRGEIKNAVRNGIQTLNGVKRITRAGMGLCQGQTCQQLVARILTEELGLSAADIDPTTARGPVRPLRLGVFANS